MHSLLIKRVYEPAIAEDGYRLLVDRTRPLRILTSNVDVDEWMQDIAPSLGLCAWWDHDSARMAGFAQRYEAELDANDSAVRHLAGLVNMHPAVTLLYGAHDPVVNHARILRDYVTRQMIDGLDG